MPIDPPVAVGGVTVGAVDGPVVVVVGAVEGRVVVVVGAALVVVGVEGVDGGDVGDVVVDGVCAPALLAMRPTGPTPSVSSSGTSSRSAATPSRVGARRCAAPPGEEAKRTG